MWYILERDKEYDESHNPARFSLLFVSGEGAAMYKALYLANERKPKIFVYIPAGCNIVIGANESEWRYIKCLFSREDLDLLGEDLLPDYFVGQFYSLGEEPRLGRYLLKRVGDAHFGDVYKPEFNP